ncbi:uncharacterized protein LOC114356128 [Ostrinia furnacalis]|uniref:uncharacterized protein LOC114356128 n=1 Tax=Ostrinia furnacalis TaxID=93504 RepID=UPI00103B9751|nr:uncharacterized protein LOC114356128 [Ostrinia furnacalis]
MSSEASVSTSSSSRIRQFGLYRTIDARTEEFLRLSRKRQIKQGCACAAVSTAITVTVVIVILLIYEYAIAVESSLVQSIRRANRKLDITNVSNDTPFADRLDRSYFGFDQDYYERMPLLVNAMQENSYIDPTIDTAHEHRENYLKPPTPVPTLKTNYVTHVRRTSPRPFFFEYKSPTPVPFSKTYKSKSWIESYRNAQRLKNIQQVIKYLEKTINAKIGDMYTLPSSKQIAFTGLYLEPSVLRDKSQESEHDLSVGSSEKVGFVNSNHQADPLFKYKPDSPGEVNLLADGFLQFSPNSGGRRDLPHIPMFRPIPSHKRACHGQGCDTKKLPNILSSPSSSETHYDETSNFSQAKSFSVMLNLFPLKSHSGEETKKIDHVKKTPLDKIYLTTSKPLILFKRKSTSRRRTIPTKRPRIAKEHKVLFNDVENNINSREKINESAAGSNMIVQINLYTPDKKSETSTTTTEINKIKEHVTSSTETNIMNFIPTRTTELPFLLSTTQVEDYHVGSSGIIPVDARVPPPTTQPPVLPQVTTVLPFFDVTLTSTEGVWFTKPPDILKFSHEDAKIPEEYRKYRESDVSDNIFSDINRRNFRSGFEMGDFESRTLVTRLKNEQEYFDTTTIHEETTEQTTTTTQNNGHYRSFNHKPKILSSLLDPNSEMNRKRRLNLYAKGFRRASFSRDYVEIQRNSTNSSED